MTAALYSLLASCIPTLYQLQWLVIRRRYKEHVAVRARAYRMLYPW
jgi:hypothetical protein